MSAVPPTYVYKNKTWIQQGFNNAIDQDTVPSVGAKLEIHFNQENLHQIGRLQNMLRKDKLSELVVSTTVTDNTNNNGNGLQLNHIA